jgi:hypothetical protein
MFRTSSNSLSYTTFPKSTVVIFLINGFSLYNKGNAFLLRVIKKEILPSFYKMLCASIKALIWSGMSIREKLNNMDENFLSPTTDFTL